MARYEYWAHSGGQHFLIRLDEDNRITGVCGPMRQASIPAANLHNYDYDSQPQHTEWIRKHMAEFHPIAEFLPRNDR